PRLYPALAEERKRNSQPQCGPYLCRRHFHFESGSAPSGQPIGCALSVSVYRDSIPNEYLRLEKGEEQNEHDRNEKHAGVPKYSDSPVEGIEHKHAQGIRPSAACRT